MRALHWSEMLPLLALLLSLGLEVLSEDNEINSVQISPTPNSPTFEFPVQLIGFPVIILAVRLSNFVKKLAYSLNPRTYVKRTRRGALPHVIEDIDPALVEQQLVEEMGNQVCVYEDVCRKYAIGKELARMHGRDEARIDWQDVVRKYELAPKKSKEFYLLSVFLGDIVASPKLCHDLVGRGRACD